MDSEKQTELIHQIANPDPRNASKILNELGLSGLPSREQVHREIEEKLLLPQDTLPAHWLSKYQVYGELCPY